MRPTNSPNPYGRPSVLNPGCYLIPAEEAAGQAGGHSYDGAASDIDLAFDALSSPLKYSRTARRNAFTARRFDEGFGAMNVFQRAVSPGGLDEKVVESSARLTAR